MGSTAIIWMMGKPMIDFAVFTQDLLPDIPKEFIKDMEAQGYTYCGAAPHYLDKFSDQWFWKKNSEKVYAET